MRCMGRDDRALGVNQVNQIKRGARRPAEKGPMERIDQHMHEIRRRFVQGLLMKMEPKQLRAFVTGVNEGEAVVARRGKLAA